MLLNVFHAAADNGYAVSLTGAFGLGYGLGSEDAQSLLSETGSEETGVIASEVWRVDLAAKIPVPETVLGVVLDLALGTSAFSVAGYNSEGVPLAGCLFSVLSLDIASLLSLDWTLPDGLLNVQAGPFVGFNLGDGRIVMNTAGVSSSYTVSADELGLFSFGALVNAGYKLELGPGALDVGLKIGYRAASVQGFIGEEPQYVHIITPYIFAGYSVGL